MTGEAAAPKFRAGDRVIVRVEDAPGHVRTPAYIQGKSGVIERACGAFPDPGELAHGRAGRARPLYRVRFLQNDVWPQYEGHPEDTLDVEIFEHWLDAAVAPPKGKDECRTSHPRLP